MSKFLGPLSEKLLTMQFKLRIQSMLALLLSSSICFVCLRKTHFTAIKKKMRKKEEEAYSRREEKQ
jgi:hypothetical protein